MSANAGSANAGSANAGSANAGSANVGSASDGTSAASAARALSPASTYRPRWRSATDRATWGSSRSSRPAVRSAGRSTKWETGCERGGPAGCSTTRAKYSRADCRVVGLPLSTRPRASASRGFWRTTARGIRLRWWSSCPASSLSGTAASAAHTIRPASSDRPAVTASSKAGRWSPRPCIHEAATPAPQRKRSGSVAISSARAASRSESTIRKTRRPAASRSQRPLPSASSPAISARASAGTHAPRVAARPASTYGAAQVSCTNRQASGPSSWAARSWATIVHQPPVARPARPRRVARVRLAARTASGKPRVSSWIPTASARRSAASWVKKRTVSSAVNARSSAPMTTGATPALGSGPTSVVAARVVTTTRVPGRAPTRARTSASIAAVSAPRRS
ncbi:hypothetical protein [Nocardioides sp. BYT-33-1]|uniref:pentapeptide repeat-containing protein n=1 Tax=Nocardioides sp. BYT-33-1 TaxID=3416952 RepID=UPI003F52AB76